MIFHCSGNFTPHLCIYRADKRICKFFTELPLFGRGGAFLCTVKKIFIADEIISSEDGI